MIKQKKRGQGQQLVGDEDYCVDDGNAVMDVEEDNEKEGQIGYLASTALNTNFHQPTEFPYPNVSFPSALS